MTRALIFAAFLAAGLGSVTGCADGGEDTTPTENTDESDDTDA